MSIISRGHKSLKRKPKPECEIGFKIKLFLISRTASLLS